MSVARTRAIFLALLGTALSACSSGPPADRRPPAPSASTESRAGILLVEALGDPHDVEPFVKALREQSLARGGPELVDDRPLAVGKAGTVPDRQMAPAEPSRDWKPSTVLRLEVRPVSAVERVSEPGPRAAGKEATGGKTSAEHYWEATSQVRAQLLDPRDRRPTGLIDVQGRGASGRSPDKAEPLSEAARAKAMDEAAAQLVERLRTLKGAEAPPLAPKKD